MSGENGGYVLVLRRSKKGISPPHLIPYQGEMRRASLIAADQTKHLKGAARVMRMNQIVSDILKGKAR